MGKFAKWIAGGLGWAFLGPLGGIVGFVVGSMMDTNNGQAGPAGSTTTRQPHTTTTGGYVMSLLVLVAAVMKADGKVLRSELEYVKQFFVRSFGSSSAQEAIKMLRDLLKQNIPVADVCLQIQKNMDYSSRLQLLHFLFGIAQADGQVDTTEFKMIEHMAQNMGISSKDFESIKAMFIANTDAAYKILEVDANATDEEIKKAYRKMAMKYHPDKVSYLGEDFQNAAKEKFQKVNEAYESIKKERKFA
ncbi:TerB family tellurite resistance protein [Sunxiuqinia elliptica]|uniref:DnaJ like chaperone protein n=1 Tax=Sunxiuqinia elliptica TaxID=655355 RepID=A0A4R6GPH9_9BACT|nr:TerB family tellurite resistance protein [Sunxiuqinia elliptica]TDN97179.1 DnaJ like chaperone protein [Sunxiuqinia elliptica]TDO60637.1 DnaJ like chaperone protein [Sunxiuqinia elliptica]